MENNVIYNQRFNKAASDIEAIVREFKKFINQDNTTADDLVRIQLLKNEFKTATNSLLEEVEDTNKSKVTILTELNRNDIEAIRSIDFVYDHEGRGREKARLALIGLGKAKKTIGQFVELLKELKEHSE